MNEPIVRNFDPSEFPDEIPDKLQAKMLLELVYGVVADIEKGGWDQPAHLMLIRQRERETFGPGVEAALLEASDLPGFQRAMTQAMEQEGGRPHHAIVHAAYAWANVLRTGKVPQSVFDEVVAVALVHEGWGLFGRPGDAEDVERITAISRDRKIHASPERVECRMVSLAGRDHLRVGYLQPRDGFPQHMVSRVVPGRKDESTASSGGNIPDAVHYFMRTIELGRLPMEYPDWDALFDITPPGT